MKFISLFIPLCIIKLVNSLQEANYQMIATPSASPSEFKIWNYTYLIDTNNNYRTIDMRLIQTSTISGTVSSLYKELNSNSWVFVGDLSGNIHFWEWNSISNNYTLKSINPSLAGEGIYSILGTYLNNGSGTVSFQAGELIQQQWDLNPDNTIASRSRASPYDQSTCDSFVLDGYYFDGSKCSINCSVSPDAASNLKPAACICQSGFHWDGEHCQKYEDLLTLERGIVWDTTTATFLPANCTTNPTLPQCNCTQFQYWQPTNQSCNNNCTAVPYSNGTSIDATQCYCNAGFLWNTAAKACWLDCGNATTLSGGPNLNATACLCNISYKWETSLSQCIVNCSGMANSNQNNYNSTQCYCNTDSYWNASANSCYLNCSGVLNSSGFNVNADQCNCSNGFKFSRSDVSCWLNCSALANSNGSNINRTSCYCNTGAKLNDTTNLCEPHCQFQPHSNGTNINDTFCYCNEGFTWNASVSACWLNCAIIPRTTFPLGVLDCACMVGYLWQQRECWIDCSNKQNSSKLARTTEACNCDQKYYWNTTLKQCMVDCTAYNHTNGTNPLNSSDCLCLSFFTRKDGQCIVDCTLVPYSENKTVTPQSLDCVCSANYTWDPILKACLPDAPASKEATAIGVGVGVGVPVTIGVVTAIAVVAGTTAPAVAVPVIAVPAVAIGSQAAIAATATAATTAVTTTTATTAAASTTAATTAATTTTAAAANAGATVAPIAAAHTVNATAVSPMFVMPPPLIFWHKRTNRVLFNQS